MAPVRIQSRPGHDERRVPGRCRVKRRRLALVVPPIDVDSVPALHLAFAVARPTLVTAPLRLILADRAIDEVVVARIHAVEEAAIETTFPVASRAVVAAQLARSLADRTLYRGVAVNVHLIGVASLHLALAVALRAILVIVPT